MRQVARKHASHARFSPRYIA